MSEAQVGIRILLEDGASAGLGNLKGALSGVANSAAALEPVFKRDSAAMQAAGVIAAGSGLVFLGFTTVLSGVITKAMDLQLSMSHVESAVQGASSVMPKLQADLIDIANNSIFTSKEVADAFVVLGEKGFTAGQILANDGMLGKAVISFAEATNSQAVPAAQVLGSTLRAFGADASQSAYYADVLTAAFYNGIGSAAQLQSAFSQVSGRAHEVGWTVKDTAVALDILTRNMGSGSQAGTSLQYMLASLTNPTAGVQKELTSLGIITMNDTVPAFKFLEDQYAKTGSAAGKSAITYDGTITSLQGQYAAAQKMGLLHTDQTFYQWATANGVMSNSLYDSAGNFKSLTGVVDTLGAALKGSPEQMNALIGALGGARSGKAFTVLLSNIGATDTQIKDLYARFGETTAVTKAQTNLDNLSSTLKKLGTTFNDLEALIGLPMLKPLQAWGDKLNALINNVELANPHLLGLAGQFLLIGTAVSGVIFFVSSFIFIMGTLGPIALAVVGVALAVTGLAVAGTAIYTHWSEVKSVFQPLIDVFKEVWQVLEVLGGVVKDIAINAFGHLRDAAAFVKEHWGVLAPVFADVKSGLQGVSAAIKAIEPYILAGMDAAARALGQAAIFVHDHWHLLTPVFSAVATALGHVKDIALIVLGLVWEGIIIAVHKLGDAGGWVVAHWGQISTVAHSVADSLGRIKDVLVTLTVGALGAVVIAVHALGDAGAWVKTHWGQIKDILGGVFSLIASSIPSVAALGGAIAVVGNWSAITAGVSGVMGVLSGLNLAMGKAAVNVAQFGMTMANDVLTSGAKTIPMLWGMVAPLLAEAGAALLALAPWIIAGVIFAGALVGLVLLVQHFNLWPKILGTFKAAWDLIVIAFQNLVKVIQGEVMSAIKQMHPAWLQLVDAFNTAKPVLIVLGGILLAVLGVAFTTVLGIILGFIGMLGGLIHIVASVVLGIVQVFSGLITFFNGLFHLIRDIFTGNIGGIMGDFGQMGQGLKMIFTGIWTAISGIVGGFFQAIGGLVSGFISAFIGMFKHLGDMLVGHSLIPDMLREIFAWFARLPGMVLGFVGHMVDGVLSLVGHLKDLALNGLGALGNLVMGIFVNLAQNVPGRVGDMVNGILSLIASLPGRILSALGNLGSLLLQAGQSMIQGLISGILSQISNITGAATQVAQGIANIFQHHSPPKVGPLQTDDQWMHSMMLMHAAQITTDAPLLSNAASLAARGIAGAFSSPSQLALSARATGAGGAGGAAGATRDVHIHNYLDSKEISTMTLDVLTGQLRMNGMSRLSR